MIFPPLDGNTLTDISYMYHNVGTTWGVKSLDIVFFCYFFCFLVIPSITIIGDTLVPSLLKL